MPYAPISFARKFSLFFDRWQPKVVAEMNDYQFQGRADRRRFVAHQHADTDETFIVLDGTLRIDFRDGSVTLDAGEMYVVPKGERLRPCAERRVEICS